MQQGARRQRHSCQPESFWTANLLPHFSPAEKWNVHPCDAKPSVFIPLYFCRLSFQKATVSFSSNSRKSDVSATPREKVRGFNRQRKSISGGTSQTTWGLDFINVAEDGHESETILSEVTDVLCAGVQRIKSGRSSAFNDGICSANASLNSCSSVSF